MTIQGAIYELNNMLSSKDIPFYWKPAIKKIIETVEQNVGEMSEKQTDGDLISRQSVKDLIRGLTKWGVRSQDGKFENVGLLYDDVMFGIDRLPSAEKTTLSAEKTTITDGDLIAEIDKLPRIKVGNSNSPTVKYCIDEVLLYDLLEHYKESEEEE